MTRVFAQDLDPQWSQLIQRAPASTILQYVHDKWHEYVTNFNGKGRPLYERNEPELTKGLAAFLTFESDAGRQTVAGEFFGELHHFDLRPDGTAVCIGRTDIEWRLFGFSNFIIEFKILGGGRRAGSYITDGMARFIDGRYGPRASEGAMCALVHPAGDAAITDVEEAIESRAGTLRCVVKDGTVRLSPSILAPMVANFDSIHERDQQSSPIHLAHIFIALPAS